MSSHGLSSLLLLRLHSRPSERSSGAPSPPTGAPDRWRNRSAATARPHSPARTEPAVASSRPPHPAAGMAPDWQGRQPMARRGRQLPPLSLESGEGGGAGEAAPRRPIAAAAERAAPGCWPRVNGSRFRNPVGPCRRLPRTGREEEEEGEGGRRRKRRDGQPVAGVAAGSRHRRSGSCCCAPRAPLRSPGLGASGRREALSSASQQPR